MNPTLIAPYQRMIETLTAFVSSMHAAQPVGPRAARWRREAQWVGQTHRRLHAAAAANQSEVLTRVARELTQLARTQDGLRFEDSAAAPPTQLRGERQMVVLAAWQLLQVLGQMPRGGTNPQAARWAPDSDRPAGTAR